MTDWMTAVKAVAVSMMIGNMHRRFYCEIDIVSTCMVTSKPKL